MKYKRFYEARDVIEDLLLKDLFGPVDEEEIIEEYPTQYYAMGILFPKHLEIDQLEQINTSESRIDKESYKDDMNGDSFEDVDEGVSLSNMYNPSSMAISTTIKSEVDRLKVLVQYGRYIIVEDIEKDNLDEDIEGNDNKEEQIQDQTEGDKDKLEAVMSEDGDELKNKKRFQRDKWKRISFSNEKIVELSDTVNSIFVDIDEGLQLQVYIQKKFSDGSKTLTIALINTNEGNKSLKIDNINSFFQVQFQVTAENEEDYIFIPKRMSVEISEDPEINILNMLYSHINNYAVGHGCSVEGVTNSDGCYKLCSRVVPIHEIKQMKASVRTSSKLLKMNFLANGSKIEIQDSLMELVKSYNEWIEEQDVLSQELDKRSTKSAETNLRLCKESSKRIEYCIKLFDDFNVFNAFQLANQAMLKQRMSYMERDKKAINYDEITWYPFQLAFILQEIPSIVNANDDFRNIVDLLWFPTGGGKTEAYLGLSGFVIFFRRLLRKEKGEGVNIIMRYTLRLLTIQQFERAAALICACESIRRIKTSLLGNEEISIGLFVGAGLTPNNLADADTNLQEVKRSGMKFVRNGNPCQIVKCPVCGSEITPNQYSIKDGKMVICCSNKACEYSTGLPIYLVDEDIYNYKPTLIISTIDKLARMTWEPKIGNIFGIGTIFDPPSLIIQDELHLISGPLGTITGLYETAVDFFCHKDGYGPKIIASTATIRNASSQILSLYGKEFRQFPAQGINIRDSYFAEEASVDEKPARKYVGVLSPSKSATTTLVRVYACLQFASRYLKDLGFEPEVIDNYWTITGYFNSLRELGGAVVQVYDDVQERYKFLYTTKFKNLNTSYTSKQDYDYLEELTSRKNQSEITKALDNLGKTFDTGEAFDYVLASNMISVGVDIGRLGLMVVTGQPKSNSEYIQASSRVGRKNPGLVVTVYNASRSRDRSHYEQFINYHSAIYKYVEATSLTPFSMRARERALHAVYISMCRHIIDELRDKKGAINYKDDYNMYKQLKEIEDFILERARIIIGDGNEYNEIIWDLDEIKTIWEDATNYDKLAYDKYINETVMPLLKNTKDEEGIFITPNSMRNVDFQSNVYLEED